MDEEEVEFDDFDEDENKDECMIEYRWDKWIEYDVEIDFSDDEDMSKVNGVICCSGNKRIFIDYKKNEMEVDSVNVLFKNGNDVEVLVEVVVEVYDLNDDIIDDLVMVEVDKEVELGEKDKEVVKDKVDVDGDVGMEDFVVVDEVFKIKQEEVELEFIFVFVIEEKVVEVVFVEVDVIEDKLIEKMGDVEKFVDDKFEMKEVEVVKDDVGDVMDVDVEKDKIDVKEEKIS